MVETTIEITYCSFLARKKLISSVFDQLKRATSWLICTAIWKIEDDGIFVPNKNFYNDDRLAHQILNKTRRLVNGWYKLSLF